MMDLKDFAKLIQQAYVNLGLKSPTQIKELWESFHVLSRKVSLAEFKILLKQLHDSDFRQYEMDRGSSRFPENRKYGIMSDKGLLCYFRYNPKETIN